MISKVSFMGKVFQSGYVSSHSKQSEIAEIQNYSNENNCDVVLLSRDYYTGNHGMYDALLIKQDRMTGDNVFAQKVFNFSSKFPIEESQEPEYMSSVRELYI